MASYLVLSATLLQVVCVAISSPLGPPGSQNPSNDFAVPHYTTDHYVIGKLKKFYSYLFNKPESIHEDGYTKIYVMGKYMYYTYTHEFTQDDGKPRDGQGNRVTADPILKQCVNEEEALKQQAHIQMHIQRKNQLEEEAIERMNREKKAKSDAEGILKKAMRNIPIVKWFV